MATTKFYLDKRQSLKGKPGPLKIVIPHLKAAAYISTGVSLLPVQWDATEGKILSNHPAYKSLNALLLRKKTEIDIELLAMSHDMNLRRESASSIKKMIEAKLNPEKDMSNSHSFYSVFQEFMHLKSKSTKGIYEQTLSRLNAFGDISSLKFENITIEWLNRFDNFLAITAQSKNARNIHFRNIRAVFNYAIDNEYTDYYPFRRFKIRPEATRKRSLSVEELRMLFDYPVEEYAEIYRDMFKLIFMFIGINIIDLHRLKKML